MSCRQGCIIWVASHHRRLLWISCPEGGEVWQGLGGSAVPAGSFLRGRVTADLCGCFICTHDTDTIAVFLLPDIFLIATLFIHKDRIYVLSPVAMHLLKSRGSESVLFKKQNALKQFDFYRYVFWCVYCFFSPQRASI